MAIVSVGYDGTVDEVQFAKMIPSVGSSQYGVASASAWKVSAHPSTAQAVNVSAGSGWGRGVFDTSDSVSTVQCDAISTGTRWDLIVARRDWQPVNGSTAFGKVTGGSTSTIPARLTNAGVQDEQPLALVQWTAGQTQPTAIIDLRVWAGNGGMVAKDELVKSYLDTLGAEVYINGVVWRYVLGANDVPGWVGTGPINNGAAGDLTSMRGTWAIPFTDNRKPRVWSTDGVTVHMTGLVQYKGSDKNVVTIPSPFAPADGSITYVGASQFSGAGSVAGGPSVHLGINGGVLQVIYQSGSLPVDGYLPLNGFWRING